MESMYFGELQLFHFQSLFIRYPFYSQPTLTVDKASHLIWKKLTLQLTCLIYCKSLRFKRKSRLLE